MGILCAFIIVDAVCTEVLFSIFLGELERQGVLSVRHRHAFGDPFVTVFDLGP